MGLPGTGKRIRVIRQPERVEPMPVPQEEPEREVIETPEREPVKV